MAETLRIEIPIETVDKTEPELSNLVKKLGKLGEAAENAGNSAQQANGKVSQFDRQAQKTEKNLAGWAKEKYAILLEAKDRLSPLLSTMKNGLKSFAGKTWNVTMRAVDLITSPVRGILNLLKNPIFQAGAILGVSIGLKDTIETYKGFEAAMSQVEAISGATGAGVAKLTEKAKEMGATTKFTAAESAEAFNYMAMAGWKTEDMLGGIEGILNLAAASGESLATTSDIVTDALTAFGKKAGEAEHFADVMAAASSNANTNVSLMGETFKYAGAMAGTLGYSIEDVALATGLMANSGIKGNMAGTALNSVFTRLSTNANGAADALKELGIDFFDSNGKARPLIKVINELREATAGFTDEQRAILGNTIAGTYAQKGFLAILNATTEDYNKLYEAVNHADGSAARMSEIMLDNLQGSLTLLQSAVDGVKISFGERLSPYVRGLADWLTAQMPVVEQGLNEFMDWIDTKIDRMQRKFNAIADTKEWQDADFFGKVKIVWDEFITEPFSKWWSSTGKAKFADFAQEIGSGIGAGLKAGIMTLLGIDLGETLEEGVSIGASFAKGFSEGFDCSAVSEKLWQGFKNLLSNAGKLLPGGEAAGLSSVVSAVMLSKIATPFIGMGRGVIGIGKGLFGTNPATGVSLVSSLIGSTGNAMVSGSGILGTMANIGYGLTGGSSTAGMYFGNMAGAMSGSTAALVGAGSTAGALVGTAGLIHGGMDLYTGFTTDDEEKAKVYKKAGAVEVGGTLAGAGAGAGIGAAIGAMFGGVGAVPGALIGAGVGAIGSWIAGNKIKEEYEKSVEEMQKEAEKAQKVFQATGLSIEDVKFKNEALTQAMNDSEVSAEQFAKKFQEECANVAKKAFGDISLSLAEVKKVAREITFADMAEELTEFAQATVEMDAVLNNLKSSVVSLKKENWKVGLGMELSETDKDGYKGAIKNFISNAQAFINDNHYEATVALKLLIGGETDTSGLDRYYGGLKSQMEELGAQLAEAMNAALEDNLVTPEEAAGLEDLQNQISAITNKLTEAKTDAEMQALQIKYHGAALAIDSFNALQEELQAYVASASEQYESALALTLTNLNLQLADAELNYNNEMLTEEEYQQMRDEIQRQMDGATEGYYAQINGLNARVSTFNLDSIATAWDSELSGIMPDIEGATTEKLTEALNSALLVHPDVKSWTPPDVISWMGLDKLNLDPADQTVIAAELIQTAFAVPDGTKEQILQNFKDQVPTAEEIKAAIDWDSLTNNKLNDILKEAGAITLDGGVNQIDMVLPDWAAMFGENYEEYINQQAELIHDALQNSKSEETLSSFMEQCMSDSIGEFDFSSVMEQYGPISNEYYEQLVAERQTAGTNFATSLNNGASTSLLEASSLLRSSLQTSLDAAITSPFSISPTVNVTPSYNWTLPDVDSRNGGSSHTSTSGASHGGGGRRFATGGYVSGGPQLSWLAEEGYGEFVIPTNPSRRARALDLYQQAGVALGVSAYADGGFVGGSNLSDNATDYNLFTGASRNVPLAHNEITEGNYSGETAETYEPSSAGMSGIAGGTPVKVKVELSPEFVIHGGDGQSEEDIMQVIRKHLKEMADELGGEIAANLKEVFSNMPLKEA